MWRHTHPTGRACRGYDPANITGIVDHDSYVGASLLEGCKQDIVTNTVDANHTPEGSRGTILLLV